jgi:tRNA(Arg) A34 adenosine deaminase TadA
VTTGHEFFIRKCYELARSAAARGNHPFGALLAKDGRVVLTAENSVHTDRDCTRHAELNLVSQAVRTLDPTVMSGSTLYTSTEPCAMCSGAVYWAGIRTVVYGCSASALGRIAGGSFVIPCRDIFVRAAFPTVVIGPVLEAEGAEIHERFWAVARGNSTS